MKAAAWLLALGLVGAIGCESEVGLSCGRFDSDYEACMAEGVECYWIGDSPQQGSCLARCDGGSDGCRIDETCEPRLGYDDPRTHEPQSPVAVCAPKQGQ